jgi:hypothetical protein
MQVGLVLFVAGLGFVIADVVPFFAGDSDRPLWLNLCCLLAPLGFALVVGCVLRRGRDEQRAADAAVRAAAGTPTADANAGMHATMESPAATPGPHRP